MPGPPGNITGHVIATYSPAAVFSALVVEPNEVDMIGIVSTLTGSGFRVSSTDNYPDAKAFLLPVLPWSSSPRFACGPTTDCSLRCEPEP